MTGGIAPASAADASEFIATIEPAAAIVASVNKLEIRAKRIHSSLDRVLDPLRGRRLRS
jgi:hypothetical protein